MTIVKESRRRFRFVACWRLLSDLASIAPQPSNPPPGGSAPNVIDDDEIPEEVLRAIEAEERASGMGRADSPPAGGGDMKECPHCTFMNVAGASDCDVCGLPM